MKFVEISEKDRENIFNSFKESYSWSQVAKSLKVSRAMLFKYKNGEYPLPIELFNKISNNFSNKVEYIEITKNKYLYKKVKKVELNETLSEIIGALAGDGHLNAKNFEVSVNCSILDKAYINYLKELFEKLFPNLLFKINSQHNKIKLRTYSISLANYLHEEYRLPLGRKMNKLHIPRQIIENPIFLKKYLRGLFDTDGSIYFRRNHEPVVEVISRDKTYLNEVKNCLLSLGFKCGSSGKNLYIYQKKMIHKFFKDIGSSNEKHLKKYTQIV